MTGPAGEPLLEVRGLSVRFRTPAGPIDAVRGVDLDVAGKGILGLVGESGSGKSITLRAVMGLLPPTAEVTGSVKFRGEELVGRSQRRLQAIRGARMAMIFQDPMSALNPVLTIGQQIVEAIRIHDAAIARSAARRRTIELLEMVAIPFPERRIDQYPHEYSGGMRQRAMIAMAMANNPELLIADEPTTALDVTVQAQIIDMLQRLREEHGIGLVLITHDLGVVAGMAESVAVMYGGRIVERGTVDDVFYGSRHPYTRGLLASLPRLEEKLARLTAIDGAPPRLARRPPGCSFHPRCRLADERCRTEEPALRRVDAVETACHLAERLRSGGPGTEGRDAARP